MIKYIMEHIVCTCHLHDISLSFVMHVHVFISSSKCCPENSCLWSHGVFGKIQGPLFLSYFNVFAPGFWFGSSSAWVRQRTFRPPFWEMSGIMTSCNWDHQWISPKFTHFSKKTSSTHGSQKKEDIRYLNWRVDSITLQCHIQHI